MLYIYILSYEIFITNFGYRLVYYRNYPRVNRENLLIFVLNYKQTL
jgi:hypothetical protein